MIIHSFHVDFINLLEFNLPLWKRQLRLINIIDIINKVWFIKRTNVAWMPIICREYYGLKPPTMIELWQQSSVVDFRMITKWIQIIKSDTWLHDSHTLALYKCWLKPNSSFPFFPRAFGLSTGSSGLFCCGVAVIVLLLFQLLSSSITALWGWLDWI